MGKKKARINDTALWSTRLCAIIRRMLELSTGGAPDLLSQSVEDVYNLEVPCAVMESIGQDQFASVALTELDVEPEDHERLSDILDPDGNGKIRVVELIEGL